MPGGRSSALYPYGAGWTGVFRTVVDRTRSRLDVPALWTPFRIRRRPEGTGQPSPKLLPIGNLKRLQGYQERIGAGLVPMGTGVLAGARLMSTAWRERLRVRAAYNRATSGAGVEGVVRQRRLGRAAQMPRRPLRAIHAAAVGQLLAVRVAPRSACVAYRDPFGGTDGG